MAHAHTLPHTGHGDTSALQKLAKAGYSAKGFTYIVVGILAISAAFGAGKASGSQSALASLANEPFGTVMLVLVGIGLIAYVVWRFVQAAKDPELEGHDKKGTAKRIRFAVSGLIYAALAVQVWMIVFGVGGGGSDSGSSSWVGKLMEQPFGRLLVGLAGGLVLVAAVIEAVSAYKMEFMKKIKTEEVPANVQKGILISGRLGKAARAVVFAIIGVFVIQAAINYDPSQAKGLGGALRTLEQQSYGPWLLAAVAVGLICYGVFQFVKAKYRYIPRHA